MELRPDAHVLIVGYGPVGQVLALLLAGRGWTVTVLEQWPAPFPLPRAVAFDGYAARVLDAVGLSDTITAIGEPSQDYVVANGAGRTLLRIGLRERGSSGWPDSTSMYQPGLEAALARRGAALPGLRVLRGTRALRLAERNGMVHVEAEDTTTGNPVRLSARWLIGCDGANSLVRAQLGVPVRDDGIHVDWMACDVAPRRPGDFSPCNLQIADPARPRVAVSAGPGHRRWEFMRLPGEPADRFGEAANAWRLLALFGVDPYNASLERHAVYTFGARNAEDWRCGRVLLAGDAAHQMPPFAGQGLCSGIRDAANLAWKLDLVLAGTTSERLLDSYACERRPHVQEVIDMSVRLGDLICVTDPAAAERRDAALLAARGRDGDSAAALPDILTDGFLFGEQDVYGEPGTRGAPGGEPATGRLSPQGRITWRGRTGLFDDIAGRGFVLLARQDPATLLTGDQIAFLRGIGAHLVTVGSPATASQGHAVDLDGVYLPWLGSLGAVGVLIRPDFYVYGAGADAAGLGAVVESLRRRLGLR